MSTADPRTITISVQQVQRKFKHAADFGVMGRYNQTRAPQFEQALRSHVEAPTTLVIQGTYRGEPVTHFVNPQMGLNVIRGADGAFVSAWRLTRHPGQRRHDAVGAGYGLVHRAQRHAYPWTYRSEHGLPHPRT